MAVRRSSRCHSALCPALTLPLFVPPPLSISLSFRFLPPLRAAGFVTKRYVFIRVAEDLAPPHLLAEAAKRGSTSAASTWIRRVVVTATDPQSGHHVRAPPSNILTRSTLRLLPCTLLYILLGSGLTPLDPHLHSASLSTHAQASVAVDETSAPALFMALFDSNGRFAVDGARVIANEVISRLEIESLAPAGEGEYDRHGAFTLHYVRVMIDEDATAVVVVDAE